MSTFLINPTKEQEKIVAAFLDALEITFVKDDNEVLPTHVLEGIARGLSDIEAGRFITHGEFIKRIGVVK